MSREIRHVPANWQHPRDERGRFRPLLDEDYQTACRKWWEAASAWERGEFPSNWAREESARRAEDGGHFWYWEYSNGPPEDDACYVPRWDDAERTHYQIYETVSEGTPCSPVFASLTDLVEWMTQPIDRGSEYNRNCADWQSMQGRTREQAEAFAGVGHSIGSVVLVGGRMIDGVAACSELAREPEDPLAAGGGR